MNKKKSNRFFMLGNEACGAGAIAAGVRFFAGYPITPSTEIAEYMARELPKVGGIFIQMEDELASMGALLGASAAGAKAMTATSGPGFTLMQEFIRYAGLSEIPCVIVDVMRGGMIQPAQGDVMQSRWGPYGNHPVIVLSASTVPEMFFLTIKAVNFSEKFRVPVILLSDESIAHLRETVEIPDVESLEIIDRKKPEVPPEDFEPMSAGEDLVPPMACIGEGYRVKGYSGLVRNKKGNPTSDPETKDYLTRRLQNKIDYHVAEIQLSQERDTEDADVVIFSHGSVVRPAHRASTLARQMGIKTGVLKATTIWPFPRENIERLSKRVKAIIVPELNLGQLICEVERWTKGRIPVIGIQKVDGNLIKAEDILAKVEEVAK